jgi:hypothetical protein
VQVDTDEKQHTQQFPGPVCLNRISADFQPKYIQAGRTPYR